MRDLVDAVERVQLVQPIIVIGGGGHAKVCIETLVAEGRFRPHICLDRTISEEYISGVPTATEESYLQTISNNERVFAFVAIGDNFLREKLALKFGQRGFSFPSAVHPRAFVSPSARVGAGVLIMPGAVVNAEAQIDDFAIINTNAVVEHDCIVGRCAHVAPGAVLTGGVTVGDHAFFGAGAVARQHVIIGACSIVGAGSVVVSNIPEEATYAGVPARRLNL